MRLGAAVVGLLVCSAVAYAEPAPGQDRHVAVLEFDFKGLARDSRPGFEASLEIGLANAGWVVSTNHAETQRLLAESHSVVPGCRVGPCLVAVGRALGVPYVIHGSVAARGAEFNIILTVMETRTGRPVGQTVKSCPVCTADEALVLLSAAGEKIALAVDPGTGPRMAPRPATWPRTVGKLGMLLGAAAIALGVYVDDDDSGHALFASGFTAFVGGSLIVGATGASAPGGRRGLQAVLGWKLLW